jgi:hypothetical protein
VGNAADGCPDPPPNSGKAVARLTVNTAVPSTLRVTASIGTQDDATNRFDIYCETAINDPPAPPDGLVVEGGSIVVRFNPSKSATATPKPAPTPTTATPSPGH